MSTLAVHYLTVHPDGHTGPGADTLCAAWAMCERWPDDLVEVIQIGPGLTIHYVDPLGHEVRGL